MTEQELNSEFGIYGIPIKPNNLIIGVNSHTNTIWRNIKFKLDKEKFNSILVGKKLKIKTTQVKSEYTKITNNIKPIPTKQNIENFHLALCLLVWKKIAEYWNYIDSKGEAELERPNIITNWSDKFPESAILNGFDNMAGYMVSPSKANLKKFEQMIEENLKTMKNTVDRLKKDSGESVNVQNTSKKIERHYKLYADGSNPEIEAIQKQMEEVKNNSKLSQSEKDEKLEQLHNQLIKSGKTIDDNISNEIKRLYRLYLKSLNTYISRAQNELDVKKFSRQLAVNRLAKLRKMGSDDNLSTGAKAYFEELAGVNNRAHVENLSEFLSDTGRHSNFLKSVDPDAKLTVKLDGATVASNLRKKFGGGKVLTEKTEAAEKPETTGNVQKRTSLWEDKARAAGKKSNH